MTDDAAGARYYPAAEMKKGEAVPGVQFWGVRLSKAMLTCFELQPGARFDKHQHEAEQITLVLSGRLVFEVGEQRYTLGPGDVIAIPSNVPHAVQVLDGPVKAVDAWSPPRESYCRS